MASTLYLRTLVFDSHATFTYLLAGRGGGVVSYVTTATAAGNQIQATKSGGGVVAEWLSPRTPAGGFTLSGQVSFNIWAFESGTAIDATLSARLYRRTPGGTETEVTGGPFSLVTELPTSVAAQAWNGTPAAGLAFAEDDRLVVRLYIDGTVDVMGAGSVTIRTNGLTAAANGDSFITLTEDVAWKTENNLKTLKTSGGDFTAPSTWESANQSDLVADNCIASLECYDGSYPNVSISGWTTGPDNYIRVYAPFNQRSPGQFRANTGFGVEFTVAGNAFAISEDYVRVEGIEAVGTSGAGFSATSMTASANDIRFESCIGRSITSGASGAFALNQANARVTLRNCIGYSELAASTINVQSADLAIIEHCVGINTANATAIRWGATSGTSHTLYNNYAYSATGVAFSRPDSGITEIGGYNASDDATADDNLPTGALINLAPADQFVSFTGGSEDFHLKAGSDLIGAGNPLVDVTTDIDDDTRNPTTPDIGADEFISFVASDGITPSYFLIAGRRHRRNNHWQVKNNPAKKSGIKRKVA